MRNAGLDEARAGIKIAGRNINNLRYADNTVLMEESEEELKSLLMKVKEESEKGGLKLNIQKTNIMANRWGNNGNGDRLFWGTPRASLVAQRIKHLPAMQETWVQSLGWEDPLKKGKATHSSILAWRIPWTV